MIIYDYDIYNCILKCINRINLTISFFSHIPFQLRVTEHI